MRDDARIEAAVDWMVVLRSGEVSAVEQQKFSHWLAADKRNEAAWIKIAGALAQSVAPVREATHGAPGHIDLIQQTLLRPNSRRRILRGAMGFVALAAGGGALLNRVTPLRMLNADLHTATGERRSFALPDGSTLMLNARSAADVNFNGQQRLVHLRSGELIATATADANRPFVVQTEHGSVRALGTRFMVREQKQRTLALVLEHSVRVIALSGETRDLREGESVWFDQIRVDAAHTDMIDKASWAQGMLTINDESLGEVIETLRPYRQGVIRVSPEAARLRVLGAFPLDDSIRVIESLAQTLPINVTVYGDGWLVMINALTEI
jgi:transmembrane sensor